MGVFLGVGFLAFVFGPAAVLYWKVVSKKPETNLIAISAAMTWLLSIMLPSLLEAINGGVRKNEEYIPLYLVIAALFQEAARFLYVREYMKGDTILMRRARLRQSYFSDFSSALSAGLGIAVIYSFIVHGGAISAVFDERNEGDFYDVELCPEFSFYIVTAITALCFQFMHISLSLLTFHYFRQQVNYSKAGFLMRLGFVCGLHILTSLASLSNQLDNGCSSAVPAATILICAFTGYTVTRSSYQIRQKTISL